MEEVRFPQTTQSGSAFGGGRTAAAEERADAAEGEVKEGEAEVVAVAPVAVVFPPLFLAIWVVVCFLSPLLSSSSRLVSLSLLCYVVWYGMVWCGRTQSLGECQVGSAGRPQAS